MISGKAIPLFAANTVHRTTSEKSGRAFAIIARANCKQGDLGGAKAAMHSVDSRDLARVKHECKAAGIDL